MGCFCRGGRYGVCCLEGGGVDSEWLWLVWRYGGEVWERN